MLAALSTLSVDCTGVTGGRGGPPLVIPSRRVKLMEFAFSSRMKLLFCGWIYKEHWTNDVGRGEGGSGDETVSKMVISFQRTMTQNGRHFFEEKIGWHHQLPHRVTPTLVTPLIDWSEFFAGALSSEHKTHCGLGKDRSSVVAVLVTKVPPGSVRLYGRNVKSFV